jgi:hypothetical protein
MLTGIQNILETQVNFYSELYKSQIHEQIGNDKFLDSIDRKLNSNINTVLEKEISVKELGEALKKMKINKSPGPDGIVTEFYKFYWQEIGNDLTEVFQNSFKSENLPQSQYLAAIRLVFKKGQRENLKNWRPISLLNTDVKILSKLLSERLKIALPNLIHKDQTGCIQGRYIGENICLIKDIINQCDEDESILLIDQEKAFDRVEFEWLFQVLKTFGFGRNFITWLKIMYKSMKSCIITNGYISKVFPVSRGIRQGDSLSALLYILQSEPLAVYLRKTNRIQGIEIPGYDKIHEIRNKHYVDDTFVCLKNINMTDECLNIFDEFGAVSGSKLNREKTIGLVMNDIKIYDNEINSGVNLTMGPVNVLGIPVGKNMTNDFWDTLIAKIKKKLSMWQHRNLSLCGKVQIIKSLGMSKLLFASNFLSVDDSVIRKVENLFYDNLWDGKKTRVKKEICILPKKLGGISMIDVRLALKVQNIKWIKRLLLAEGDDDWAVIPLRNIRCLDRKFGVELFSLQVNDARNILKTVTLDRAYKEWLDDYQEFMRKSDKKLNDDILWCNKDIKFNGKRLEFAHWAKSGILYVRDVVNNGIINEPYIFERLIHKASFYFDISRLKASIPQNLLMKNYTDQNTFANTSQNIILNTQLTLSDGKICSFNDMTSKDLYNVFLEKNRSEIKSKVYWQYKFTDMNLNFDVWYSCNFTNWLIPRKCLDFNWRFFRRKINTEARLSIMRLSNGFLYNL